MRRRFIREDAGQAIVILALAFTGLMGAAGLAIDAGALYVERRHEQIAADAAAFAAATTLVTKWELLDRATLARSSALDYAARNGYDNNGTAGTVTVNIPPLSGAFVNNSAYVEVIVAVEVRTSFMRLLGPAFETRRVTARAVGGVTGPQKPYALIALSRTASPGALFDGDKVKVDSKDAGIMINSSAAVALQVNGSVDIKTLKSTEGSIDVVGGVSIDSKAKIDGVVVGAPPINDPLAYLTRPSVDGLPTFAAVNVTSGTTTIQPGIYPSLRVSGNGKIKLAAGTYIIRGGGISILDHGHIDDQNDGVILVNACSDYPLTTGTCGALTMTGHAKLDLKRKDAGPASGVSYWQPCENTQPISVNGVDEADTNEKARIHTRGAFYAPCAALNIGGDAKLKLHDDNDVDQAGMVVVNTLSLSGKADVKIKWKDAEASGVVRIPSLVE